MSEVNRNIYQTGPIPVEVKQKFIDDVSLLKKQAEDLIERGSRLQLNTSRLRQSIGGLLNLQEEAGYLRTGADWDK